MKNDDFSYLFIVKNSYVVFWVVVGFVGWAVVSVGWGWVGWAVVPVGPVGFVGLVGWAVVPVGPSGFVGLVGCAVVCGLGVVL